MTWPAAQPRWLEAWATWYLAGRHGARPAAPLPIPPVGWQFERFCLWRQAGGLPSARPAGLWLPVPAWAWPAAVRVLAALRPPPPEPELPGSWTLPDPLIFTAWGFETGQFDGPFIRKMGATKGTIAIQLGHAGSAEADALRQAGATVAGWGVSNPATDRGELGKIGASGYMPQVEGPSQYASAVVALDAGVGHGLDLGCVCITTPAGEVGALVERGVTTAYMESYAPEGYPFNDLPRMVWQARNDGWPHVKPAIGLYHGWQLGQYDLTPYGRRFGVWLAEEVEPGDWPKLAAP